jgi:hypothetical protein
MLQNIRSKMSEKYPRTINFNFLHAEFSIINLMNTFSLLATNTCEEINFHPNELLRELCVEPTD